MKKAIYLVTLLFAIVLMNTSCTKDNTKPDVKTLNPDWKNLTWSQTFINSDNTNTPQDYPRISFKLNATCDTLTSTFIDSQTAEPVYIPYINITLNGAGDMVTLTPVPKFGNDAISYKYEKDNGKITLDNGVNYYRYVLIIN